MKFVLIATFIIHATFQPAHVNAGFEHRNLKKALSATGRYKRDNNNNKNVIPPPATIMSLTIDSKTSSRFTQVHINSVLANDGTESREAVFLVQIPQSAFISNFSMLINGTWLVSTVMEKAAAQKTYDDAQKQNQSAGHVSADKTIAAPRDMDNFRIAINVAAKSEVEFNLLYSELLVRKLGSYTQKISIRPGQVVSHLSISAQFYEPQGFAWFKFTPPGESEKLESSRLPGVELTASNTFKEIQYSPSIEDQSKVPNQAGIMGDFVIEYDVQRENNDNTGGLLLIDGGYFVHYIAPSGPSLEVLDKNVVFVIDVSGSMSGSKIEQTRAAMITILQQLRTNDYFNILLFSSSVKMWMPLAVVGSPSNILNAQRYVRENVIADGGTNIEAGLREAGITLSHLVNALTGNRGRMIVFLTDGMPSVGVTNTKEIRSKVRAWNSEMGIPIFSLGFGEDVSFDFLQQLSWENNGFARKIYYDSVADGSSQLENFFKEVESVILVDITVVYNELAVVDSSLTRTTFPQYFKGSELIVAGEITPSSPDQWTGELNAKAKSGAISYNIPVSTQNDYNSGVAPWSVGFAEKLRAYLKIQDLLREMSIASEENVKTALKEEALRLSLKYNFVTPVTSLVVTQSAHRYSVKEDSGNRLYSQSGIGALANLNTKPHQILLTFSLLFLYFWF